MAAAMVVGIALADTVQADADVLTLGNQTTVDLGTVVPGATLDPTVRFYLTCEGKSHADEGQTVTIAYNAGGSTAPAVGGASVSATAGSVGPVPENWPDDVATGSGNCGSPAPTSLSSGSLGSDSTVTIVAPTTPGGPYAYTVAYSNATLSPMGTGDPQSITGSVSTITYTLTVAAAPANNFPVADAGDDVSGSEGFAIALDGSESSDPDSDPLIYSWTIDTTGIDAGGACTFDDATSVTPEVTCTDEGVFSATLTVTDTSDASDSDDATVTVGNASPEVTSFACPTEPQAVNTSVPLGGSFTDDGSNDTHTASYAWGDGHSSAGTVSETAGSGTVSGSHTYESAGIYTPELTVSDDDTGSDTEPCRYVVVYDPSAGFVTGGGWIDSPAGAYVPDPAMTGKATFGFVSKYKKGATTPEGSTEFQFHAAGLNFKSTSYQWLVVGGSKATYKGWGTINGQGSYGFLLAALDGSPDKFRIKIWDVGSGDVVYDNNLGGGDDADPAIALGGGSIVIHTGKK
jgi:REJ domain.